MLFGQSNVLFELACNYVLITLYIGLLGNYVLDLP